MEKKTKRDQDLSVTNAYSLFVYAIRTKITRDYYLRRLRTFLTKLDYRTLNNLGNDISRELEKIKVTIATVAKGPNLVQLKKTSSFSRVIKSH